jgi:hypothetical protein
MQREGASRLGEKTMKTKHAGLGWGRVLGSVVLASTAGTLACVGSGTDGGSSVVVDGGSNEGGPADAGSNDGNQPDVAPPPDASGVVDRTCTTQSDCGNGIFCEIPTGLSEGMCATACSTGADCASGHDCLSDPSIGIASTCFKLCTSPADCPGGMGCYLVNNGAEQACMPTSWIPTKQIGDPCTANAECVSGTCDYGGWCTKPCATSADCAGSGANWCVTTKSGNICFPDCGNVCGNYPGSTCRSTVSTEGYAVSVCSG